MLPQQGSPKSGEHSYGFLVKTPERNFELYTSTYLDAQHWVDGLNSARDIAAGVRVVSQSGGQAVDARPPTDVPQFAPLSNDPPPPAYYGTALSGGYGGGPAPSPFPPVGGNVPSRAAPQFGSQPPRAPLSRPVLREENKSKPWETLEEHLLQPEKEVDPFAALDALEELAGPPPEAAAPQAINPSASAQLKDQLLRDAKRLVTEGKKPNQKPSELIARASSEQQASRVTPPPSTQAQAAPMFAQPPASMAPAPPVPAAPIAEALQVQTAAPPAAPAPRPPPTAEVSAAQPRPPALGAVANAKQKLPSTAPPPVLKDESWDSEEEKSAPPSPPGYRPTAAASSSSAWSEQPRPPPAAAPRVPAGPVAPAHGESGGWDSDDEPAPAPPPKAPVRGVVGEGPALQHGAASSGWDDEDAPTAKVAVRGAPLNTCGAPSRPTETFVAAAPSSSAPKPKKANDDDDLDDLVGDILAASSSVKQNAGDSWMVPDFQCTACDFQVLCVDDFVWRNDVEYMFFRNHYPSVSKLRSGLQLVKGCRAYCCQCAWKSADAKADLADVASGLRWRQIGRKA
eukprot:TRINITY_DN6299_c0_g1_i10.p1 TRINITY_DN6299_c0_g1~~TRINITY_DN6299_c0_g1_i10.p1  ORF type:complete len:569 (+),score=97.13 TRINITY_DN6299_c0_g1_i10:105-1811(+)